MADDHGSVFNRLYSKRMMSPQASGQNGNSVIQSSRKAAEFRLATVLGERNKIERIRSKIRKWNKIERNKIE